MIKVKLTKYNSLKLSVILLILFSDVKYRQAFDFRECIPKIANAITVK